MFKKTLIRAAAAAVASVVAVGSASAAVVLTFEEDGLTNATSIGSFYTGISFTANAYALTDCDELSDGACDADGAGNFANEPSPDNVMVMWEGESIVMNVEAGFSSGFSLFHSSAMGGTISIWEGLNGSGDDPLATLVVGINYNSGCTAVGDPTGAFCRWDLIGVGFSGLAKSVKFEFEQERLNLFDNLTLGAIWPPVDPEDPTDPTDPPPNSVPEPTSLALASAALLGLAAARRRRR